MSTTPSNPVAALAPLGLDLIPVFVGELNGRLQLLVNARDLYGFLIVGRDFSTWIKERLEEFGFAEGEDYSPVLGKIAEGPGRPRTEYHLSLDTAKELAMAERNEQGRKVRRYFIECERRLLQAAPIQPAAPPDPTPLVEAVMLKLVEWEGRPPKHRRRNQAIPDQWDMFIEAESRETDLEQAKRKLAAFIIRMSVRMVLKLAIQRFNKAYQSGRLPADIMKAAELALHEVRGRGNHPNLSLSTFYRWKRQFFPDVRIGPTPAPKP
jgi:phage anti-repressor protein